MIDSFKLNNSWQKFIYKVFPFKPTALNINLVQICGAYLPMIHSQISTVLDATYLSVKCGVTFDADSTSFCKNTSQPTQMSLSYPHHPNSRAM